MYDNKDQQVSKQIVIIYLLLFISMPTKLNQFPGGTRDLPVLPFWYRLNVLSWN